MIVLVTGGAGFIGSHVIERILTETDWRVVSLDRLDTSGTLLRLPQLPCWATEQRRVKLLWHDLKAPISEIVASHLGKVDVILHLAASSHVDRSIQDPVSFVLDNVLGTAHILEYARDCLHLKAFVYFGTDEVFGPADGDVAYREWDRYRSGNPYSATKAGAEELVVAYNNTYRLPTIITHCMNVFGERQHREKFIPLVIRSILHDNEVLIHADAKKITPGSRFYIHASNVAAAVFFLLANGHFGQKYNIVGEGEYNNLALAEKIANIMGKPLRYQLVDFHSSRPGHDLRYALDGEKMERMGWRLPVSFDESLKKTVQWYLEHQEWL